ncbi:MAG: PLP-dependent transferase [Oscillospiraceae bacterium]|nr:PLP-dependent transferase [Oscillospiraceae bacterium]
MKTPIHDFIGGYSVSDFERCHTPGHKGKHNKLDITEIHGATDIVQESERIAAELFKAGRTLFSCSGSTLAIFAMLAFCANRRVTAFRGTHRSFIDAAILLGFGVDWVYTDDCVSERINEQTAAVFVTSVDYYGKIRDIKSIAKTCDVAGVPLLVDNAHGAYLVFTDSHPIQLGAAMSADSAHKTLPTLTGAAYLHIAEKHIELADSAVKAMNLFGTSSPSYLILDSLDLCNLHIAHEKEKAKAAFSNVTDLKKRLAQIGYRLFESDLLRITIDTNAYGYSGDEYAVQLRNNGISCELYDSRRIILLFSTVTEKHNTERVYRAMYTIPQKKEPAPLKTHEETEEKLVRLNVCISPRDAYFSDKLTVDTTESAGRICAGVYAVTPPCAPIIVPGEVIDKKTATILKNNSFHKIDVIQ